MSLAVRFIALIVIFACCDSIGGLLTSYSKCDYFIAPDGSNSNGNGSQVAPYKSLQAVSEATGDNRCQNTSNCTLCFKGGTYDCSPSVAKWNTTQRGVLNIQHFDWDNVKRSRPTCLIDYLFHLKGNPKVTAYIDHFYASIALTDGDFFISNSEFHQRKQLDVTHTTTTSVTLTSCIFDQIALNLDLIDSFTMDKCKWTFPNGLINAKVVRLSNNVFDFQNGAQSIVEVGNYVKTLEFLGNKISDCGRETPCLKVVSKHRPSISMKLDNNIFGGVGPFIWPRWDNGIVVTLNITSNNFGVSSLPSVYLDNAFQYPKHLHIENNTITEIPKCEIGEFSYKHILLCLWCNEGTFSNSTTLSECYKCPNGTVSKYKRSTSCTTCPAGTYANSANTNCNPCLESFFSLPGSSKCTECSEGFKSSTNKDRCIKIQDYTWVIGVVVLGLAGVGMLVVVLIVWRNRKQSIRVYSSINDDL